MNINTLLTSLEAAIPHFEKIKSDVSAVNVGWQIDHSFNVILRVCKALHDSDPNAYTSKFNILRTLVLIVGRFPRGKAKAPKSTRPRGEVTEESLREKLAAVKEELSKLEPLHANAFFYHPIFKNLNLKRTHRFLECHTHHHLRIINDIIK